MVKIAIGVLVHQPPQRLRIEQSTLGHRPARQSRPDLRRGGTELPAELCREAPLASLQEGGRQQGGEAASRSTRLPTPPRSFAAAGNARPQLTSSGSSNGGRTSSDTAMLVRSTLVRMSPGR